MTHDVLVLTITSYSQLSYPAAFTPAIKWVKAPVNYCRRMITVSTGEKSSNEYHSPLIKIENGRAQYHLPYVPQRRSLLPRHRHTIHETGGRRPHVTLMSLLSPYATVVMVCDLPCFSVTMVFIPLVLDSRANSPSTFWRSFTTCCQGYTLSSLGWASPRPSLWLLVWTPVYRPVYMVELSLNGMGTATILRVRTYREVRSRCAALML
jgi:hypothetical protein